MTELPTSGTPDERDLFEALVRRFGVLHQHPEVDFDPVGPDGDCWLYAWQRAQETGWKYVEGICWLDDNIRVRAHAWCEEVTPTGVVIHELTDGYATAHTYMGLHVNATPGGYADDVSKAWMETVPPQRGSVIEGLIMAGLGPLDIFIRIR